MKRKKGRKKKENIKRNYYKEKLQKTNRDKTRNLGKLDVITSFEAAFIYLFVSLFLAKEKRRNDLV